MRTLAEFTKTTLIGGVLIILPIYISILLLAKAISGILNLVSPITASLPASVEFRQVLAILALAAICFIAGLIARTGPGFRAKNAFEAAVPSKLPGYTLLQITINDAAVVALSGKSQHTIAKRGHADDEVAGMVFEITADELAAADRYEVAEYTRVLETLKSGVESWVYVGA